MNKYILGLSIIMVIGLGLWMRSSNNSATQPVTVSPANTTEFTVTSKNFSFAPATLVAKKGDHIKIILKNTGGFHDLKIDAFSAATTRISGVGEATVEFTADKTGSFEYYCSVGNHRTMGMKGVLIVN